MKGSRKKALEWVGKDGESDAVANAIWDTALLDRLPAGLDYYVLDCLLLHPRNVVEYWATLCPESHELFVEGVYVGGDGAEARAKLELIVHKMEVFRLRRERLVDGWEKERSKRMNRALRARGRSLQLLKGTIDEAPDCQPPLLPPPSACIGGGSAA